jgi:uncharacterized protein YbjT (DUF2867 family)
MSDTVLVVGGTGMLGEPVARRLAADGHAVRVLSRQKDRAIQKLGPGFEVVEGDVADPAALDRAMRGCTGVHVSLDGRGDWDVERRGADGITKVASRQGVNQITLISGASTCEENAWFPMTRAKLAAENTVRRSGVPFTIFRCTMFMETLPSLVREGRAMVMGRQPTAWHWVAAADYARMVAKAYTTPTTMGKTLYVYGPEALTMEQAVERYRATCAPEAKLAHVPFWILAIIAMSPSRTELRRIGLPIMRYFSKVREIGDSAEADTLLGRPATTLAEWCRGRAAPSVRSPTS